MLGEIGQARRRPLTNLICSVLPETKVTKARSIEEALPSITGLLHGQFEIEYKEWMKDWSGVALESDIHRLKASLKSITPCRSNMEPHVDTLPRQFLNDKR